MVSTKYGALPQSAYETWYVGKPDVNSKPDTAEWCGPWFPYEGGFWRRPWRHVGPTTEGG